MSAARAILAALAGLLLCAAAQAQELNTVFVSQSVPSAMTAGQSYPVSVTLKNSGTWGWATTSGHFLGSQNPQNNTNWGLNQVPVPHFVGPNQNVTFSFNVTAPATAGTYNFQWRMVNPATYGWFGATTPNVSVQVNVADAAFVSQSVPATMVAGQSASVSITLQNTGGTTWAAGSTALGSQNPQDNSAWGLNRVALPAPVAPGASATFNFSISAPSTPGTYNFQWRMLEGTSGWFGAPSTNVALNVTSGTPDANVFFIHTDHLNTPRLVTNNAQQAVWRWDQQEPFGTNVPDENPSSLGAFEFPLRFPGQYADKETNLYYNWHRNYDTQIGRYIESDPIGLEGGLNTYGYVSAKPLLFFDYFGLNDTPGWLNNNTLVCRAGTCTAATFLNGKGVYLTNGTLNNVSVVVAPNGTVPQLACTVPNGQVGFTTLGQIRALGGNVVYNGSFFNPYHGSLSGLTPAQAQSLFQPTTANTFRPGWGSLGGVLSLMPFIATPACREGDFSQCFCSMSTGMSGGNPASCSASFD